MQWSNVGGTLEIQDVQTLPFENIDFQIIMQGQHLFWFG